MPRGISRLLCRAGLVAVGLGGAALLVPSTAGAVLPNPACGKTIYHSVKLHSNMNCSTKKRNGLNIGASGVTVNLNGFELLGPDNGNFTGVNNSGGFNGVTVENGSVQGWGTGIYFEATKRANISNVQAGGVPGVGGESNDYGIEVTDSTSGTIDSSSADYNGDWGIYLESNHMVTVSNTDASDNCCSPGTGLRDGISLDTLSGDTMDGNGDEGVVLYEPLTANGLFYSITGTDASNNGDDGVDVLANSPTTLYQAQLIRNTATFNGGFGFWAYQKVKGYGNRVRGNAAGNCHNVSCKMLP